MAANPWWVVWYEPAASRAPGTAASRFLIVQAAAKSDITASSVGGAAITSVDGPFATRAAAQKDAGKGPVPGTGGKTNVQASGGADVKIGNPLSGLAAIGDFFQRLTQASTWIRVAEVVLGFGLIVVGLAHLASGTAVGKAAVRVGKAAALL